MRKILILCLLFSISTVMLQTSSYASDNSTNSKYPIGQPGLTAQYRLDSSETIPASMVETFILSLGVVEQIDNQLFQWIKLSATKANHDKFALSILSKSYPSSNVEEAENSIDRYILKEGAGETIEFSHERTGQAVLPILGAWQYLLPQPIKTLSGDNPFPPKLRYLGNQYLIVKQGRLDKYNPPNPTKVVELRPDALIGVPHNTKQKDMTRRWDDSDYELVRLSKDDFNEMIEAGMNCFRADKDDIKWLAYRNVYYWGISAADMPYPEYLYRSNYLGPILFLDEPGVCTRDHVIRPRLRKDQQFRKSITPQTCYKDFQKFFDEANNQKNPTYLLKQLASRSDVNIGDMDFLQQNLYSWETMVSTALHQLGADKHGPPASIVFEPPGRIGTTRTLPELNMAYQCQIPIDNPKNLLDIIYGFLRGAARSTDKAWGTSIYGSVNRDDAFWFFTHAYDIGAEKFFFWDSHRLACVPYNDCLAITRNLRNHINHYPHRDSAKLKQAAEVAILLPAGYNLGHVYFGRGTLWGLGELNLERLNQEGVKYRTVMNNFFTEIERCIRLGIAFDLLWDIQSFDPSGYREIVRVKEDGKVEVKTGAQSTIHQGARIPMRPRGDAPQITVDVASNGKAPLEITAQARLIEGSSLIYYTPGSNNKGVYINTKVLWELYGPEDEDYQTISHAFGEVDITEDAKQSLVKIKFKVEQPGNYRLRAATCDMAGRTAVAWKKFTIQ